MVEHVQPAVQPAGKVKHPLLPCLLVPTLISFAAETVRFETYSFSTPIGYFISCLIKYLNRASNLTRKHPMLARSYAHFIRCGDGEIRTHGAVKPASLARRYIRPLWHVSKILDKSNIDFAFFLAYRYDMTKADIGGMAEWLKAAVY